MPKQVFKIDRFDGGINEASDPRDIADNQMVSAVGVDVSRHGKLRLLGRFAPWGNNTYDVLNVGSSGYEESSYPQSGSGLITWSSDWAGASEPSQKADGYGNIDDMQVNSHYVAVWDNSSSNIYIWESHPDSGSTLNLDPVCENASLWTAGTGWAVGSNVATASGSTVDDLKPTAGIPFVKHQWYKIQVTINSMSDGELQVFITDIGVIGDDITTTGTHERYYFWTAASATKTFGIRGADDGGGDDFNGVVDDLSISRVGWNQTAVYAAGASTTGPTMFVADGGLRIIDGKFNHNFKNNVLQPIKRRDFYVDNSATFGYYEWSEWVLSDIENPVQAPTGTNQTHQVQNAGGSPTSIYEGETTTSTLPFVSLDIHSTDTTGSWPQTTKMLYYVSYIYMNNQESALSAMAYDSSTHSRPNHTTPSYRFEVRLRVGQEAAGTAVHNFGSLSAGRGPRIIGVRIYWSEKATDLSDERFLLFEGFFEKGWRFADQPSDYTAWGNQTLNTRLYATAIPSDSDQTFDNPFDSETYGSINGYYTGETVAAKFKTAVVANRTVFAGNIRQDGNFYPDRILMSAPNKFDLFPESRFLDVTVNDGDHIVALMEFGDRLLQYKRGSLTIINLADNSHEGTYQYKGLISPAGAFKTEFGIVWANENGCFLYDGRQVRELLEKSGIRLISHDTWSSFIQDPVVGYAPKFNKIIVRPEASNVLSSSNDAYLFDTVTQAWTKTTVSSVSHGSTSTNFQVDHNSDLIFGFGHAEGSDGHLVKWDDTPTGQSSMEWIGKDVDFGNPAVRKKVYKVYITYKSNSSGEIQGLDTITASTLTDLDYSATYIMEPTGGSGSGARVKLSIPDGGGTPVLDPSTPIIDGGYGYADGETLTFTDPGGATFTAAVNVVADRVPVVTYAVNGSTTFNTIGSGVFAASTNWTRGEFTFGSDANSCYSIQLKIAGDACNFEINDISFIFRTKTVN